jgi:hypothetical protein
LVLVACSSSPFCRLALFSLIRAELFDAEEDDRKPGAALDAWCDPSAGGLEWTHFFLSQEGASIYIYIHLYILLPVTGGCVISPHTS